MILLCTAEFANITAQFVQAGVAQAVVYKEQLLDPRELQGEQLLCALLLHGNWPRPVGAQTVAGWGATQQRWWSNGA